MSTTLKQSEEAYDEHFVLDNKLMLEWYPHRVVAMAAGDSMLELGLGHGFTTAFSTTEGMAGADTNWMAVQRLPSDDVDIPDFVWIAAGMMRA